MFRSRDILVAKGGDNILDGVDLDVPAGKAVAILGENGSGKSTLLRTLAMVEPDACGSVDWNGEHWDLGVNTGPTPPWPDVTIVFQSLTLWPHLTGRDNILLAWHERGASAISEAALENLFDRFALYAFLDRRPSEMSGGQRQRLALVRALAVAPKVVLLDEPSAALDAHFAIVLAEVLRDMKASNTSILFATHSLGFADRVADHYCFLSRGKVVETGPWVAIRDSHHASIRAYLDINAF